jgi:hypothetical protein
VVTGPPGWLASRVHLPASSRCVSSPSEVLPVVHVDSSAEDPT